MGIHCKKCEGSKSSHSDDIKSKRDNPTIFLERVNDLCGCFFGRYFGRWLTGIKRLFHSHSKESFTKALNQGHKYWKNKNSFYAEIIKNELAMIERAIWGEEYYVEACKRLTNFFLMVCTSGRVRVVFPIDSTCFRNAFFPGIAGEHKNNFKFNLTCAQYVLADASYAASISQQDAKPPETSFPFFERKPICIKSVSRLKDNDFIYGDAERSYGSRYSLMNHILGIESELLIPVITDRAQKADLLGAAICLYSPVEGLFAPDVSEKIDTSAYIPNIPALEAVDFLRDACEIFHMFSHAYDEAAFQNPMKLLKYNAESILGHEKLFRLLINHDAATVKATTNGKINVEKYLIAINEQWLQWSNENDVKKFFLECIGEAKKKINTTIDIQDVKNGIVIDMDTYSGYHYKILKSILKEVIISIYENAIREELSDGKKLKGIYTKVSNKDSDGLVVVISNPGFNIDINKYALLRQGIPIIGKERGGTGFALSRSLFESPPFNCHFQPGIVWNQETKVLNTLKKNNADVRTFRAVTSGFQVKLTIPEEV